MEDNNKNGKKFKKHDLSHLDMEISTASSSDCTGLIPSAPTSDAEQESYKELYNFEANAGHKKK